MIKVENIDIWGFEHAIRGMRNPMNSWEKSDSRFDRDADCGSTSANCASCECFKDKDCGTYFIGPNDLALMKKLFAAGTEHRKYLRQIFVSMDITAPLYWWKEFDTYKVGVTANSCSTMHKIADKEFTLEDFSCEHLLTSTDGYLSAVTVNGEVAFYSPFCFMKMTCEILNYYRMFFLETKDKTYWWQMIQLLPSSYNQKRTITMNYENVATIIRQRTGHKLDEWNDFVDILKKLPYVSEIMKKEVTE